MSSMVPNTYQGAALSVCTSEEGVYCFPKTHDGLVREIFLRISPSNLSEAFADQDIAVIEQVDGWLLNKFMLQTHPRSNIASYVVWTNTCRTKESWQAQTWHPTTFEQNNALAGTALAVIFLDGEPDSPSDERLLLYQGTNNSIYLRSTYRRKCRRLRRSGKPLGGKARTGIAALRKDASTDTVFFFQDTDGLLCEYQTSSDGKRVSECTPLSTTPYPHTLHSIAAVMLGEGEIRVYVQDDHLSIIEWVKPSNSDTWIRGDLEIPVPSLAAITAVAQIYGPGECIQLLWAHEDSIVRKRVWNDGVWMDEHHIFVNKSAQELVKYWVGAPENDHAIAENKLKVESSLNTPMCETFKGIPAFPMYAPTDDDADDIIVLRVEDCMLKVRRAVLSQSSSLFRDMFSIPRPPEELAEGEMYEGHPVVPLQDSAADIVLLLRVLHDGYFLSSCDAHAYTILLDLASKYQICALLPRLLFVLAHEYSASLFKLAHLSNPMHSTSFNICPLAGYYAPFGSTTPAALERMLEVGPRVGAPALAASALLLACLQDPAPPALLEHQAAMASCTELAIGWALRTGSAFGQCAHGGCKLKGVDALRAAVFPWWIITSGSGGLCVHCISCFWEVITKRGSSVASDLWEVVAKCAGFGTWDQMRDQIWEMMMEALEGRV